MCDYIQLVQSLNVIHQEGGGPIEPTDLPAESRHLDFYEAALTLTDKTWQCWALGGYRVRDAIEMISIAYGDPRDQMDRHDHAPSPSSTPTRRCASTCRWARG